MTMWLLLSAATALPHIAFFVGVSGCVIPLPWDLRLRNHDAELHEQRAQPERQPCGHHRPGGGARDRHLTAISVGQAHSGDGSHASRL